MIFHALFHINLPARIRSILCIGLIFCSFFSSARKSGSEKMEKIKEQVMALSHSKPDTAFSLALKGLKMAELDGDSNFIAFFHLQMGTQLLESEMRLSTDHLYTALKIYKALDDKEGLVRTYGDLGYVAKGSDGNPEKSLEYYHKALSIVDKNGLVIDFKMALYNNIGNIFFQEENYDSALFYFKRCFELSKQNTNNRGIALGYTNIARYYMTKEDYDTSVSLLKNALLYFLPEDHSNLPKTQYLLFVSYLNKDNPDSAFYYLDLIRDNFPKQLELAKETYTSLADYYSDIRNYELSNIYLRKSDSVKDVIESRSRKNYLGLLELEYESQLKEQKLGKLEAEMAKVQNTRIFLIISLVLVLIISFVLFRLQRQKAHLAHQNKQRAEAEKKLITTELENSEIRRQYLDDELKYTNKELISYATNMAQNNTFIQELREKIGEIGKLKDIRTIKKELSELRTLLLQAFHSNEEREAFIEKSRHLNSSLVFYLKTNYTQLSESDINFLILLLLKFDSKEIAALNNIELGSARKRRHRIRKKLEMDVDETFEDFFDKVLAEADLKITG